MREEYTLDWSKYFLFLPQNVPSLHVNALAPGPGVKVPTSGWGGVRTGERNNNGTEERKGGIEKVRPIFYVHPTYEILGKTVTVVLNGQRPHRIYTQHKKVPRKMERGRSNMHKTYQTHRRQVKLPPLKNHISRFGDRM